MKKTLLLASLVLAANIAIGQKDLAITLNSPAPGTTLGPGVQFDFGFQIDNLGSVDITPSDTVFFLPLVNGNSLVDTSQGITIAYRLTGTTLTATTGTYSNQVSFGGLNIQGGSAGPIDFCGTVFASGPNWGGVTEPNEVNNESCNSVNYDPNTIGIAENVVFVDLTAKAIDNSYYANGQYNLDIKNVNGLVEIKIINIAGITVVAEKLEANNGELTGALSVDNTDNGIYVVTVTNNNKPVSVRKIMINK